MLGGEFHRHPQLQRFCWATGERSSRFLALCNVTSSQRQLNVFLRTIKLSERTQITEVSGTERTPLHPWHNPSGEHWFDWRTRADSWEGNKEVAIFVISQFLLPDGICWLLCSSGAWQRVTNPRWSSCFQTSNMLQEPQERTYCHVCAMLLHPERLCQGPACLVARKTHSLTPAGIVARKGQKLSVLKSHFHVFSFTFSTVKICRYLCRLSFCNYY